MFIAKQICCNGFTPRCTTENVLDTWDNFVSSALGKPKRQKQKTSSVAIEAIISMATQASLINRFGANSLHDRGVKQGASSELDWIRWLLKECYTASAKTAPRSLLLEPGGMLSAYVRFTCPKSAIYSVTPWFRTHVYADLKFAPINRWPYMTLNSGSIFFSTPPWQPWQFAVQNNKPFEYQLES